MEAPIIPGLFPSSDELLSSIGSIGLRVLLSGMVSSCWLGTSITYSTLKVFFSQELIRSTFVVSNRSMVEVAVNLPLASEIYENLEFSGLLISD
jgi:hypothetical protein